MRSFNPRSAAPVQDNTGKASAPIAQNDSQLNSDPTDQSATNRKIGKDSASLQKVPRRVTVATWVVRLCFAFVFVVNVQCALGFALTPEAYMGAYELAGVPGRVATRASASPSSCGTAPTRRSSGNHAAIAPWPASCWLNKSWG